MRGHRAEGLIRHASRRRGRGWRGAGTRVCRGRSRVRGLDATTTGPQGSARTVLQRARPCGIDEELDGLGLRTGVQGAWRTQPRGRGAAAGKAHLVDVLRRKVFGDGEDKLSLGDVLARLEAIVPLVALERRHVQLREVDRLRQRAGRDSQRRPSENGRPEGQRIGRNRRRVLRVRERAARALGVWARRAPDSASPCRRGLAGRRPRRQTPPPPRPPALASSPPSGLGRAAPWRTSRSACAS